MAEIAGYGAKMVFGTNTVSDSLDNISSWSLEVNCDALDVTSFADGGERCFIRGLRGWTATVEGFLDTTAVDPTDVGDTAALKLYVNSTNYYTGSAILTGISPTAAVDGAETCTYSFQGTSDIAWG